MAIDCTLHRVFAFRGESGSGATTKRYFREKAAAEAFLEQTSGGELTQVPATYHKDSDEFRLADGTVVKVEDRLLPQTATS